MVAYFRWMISGSVRRLLVLLKLPVPLSCLHEVLSVEETVKIYPGGITQFGWEEKRQTSDFATTCAEATAIWDGVPPCNLFGYLLKNQTSLNFKRKGSRAPWLGQPNHSRPYEQGWYSSQPPSLPRPTQSDCLLRKKTAHTSTPFYPSTYCIQ